MRPIGTFLCTIRKMAIFMQPKVKIFRFAQNDLSGDVVSSGKDEGECWQMNLRKGKYEQSLHTGAKCIVLNEGLFRQPDGIASPLRGSQ
jgi:hypothetical protein